MIVHNELSGSFTGPQDKTKQITDKDIINRQNDENCICIGFDVMVDFEYNNEKYIQRFHFMRNPENLSQWQIITLLGNGSTLGDVPIRIAYETPIANFPLVKIAAMGLMYLRLTQMERMSYYEALNYELLERTNGV